MLSIPYRILTEADQSSTADDTVNFQFPIGFSPELGSVGVIPKLSTFNSLSDSHDSISIIHDTEKDLSIPYRILTRVWWNKEYIYESNFQFPIGFSRDIGIHFALRTRLPFQFPIGFSRYFLSRWSYTYF